MEMNKKWKELIKKISNNKMRKAWRRKSKEWEKSAKIKVELAGGEGAEKNTHDKDKVRILD